MTDNELKEIRQKISCPQLGDKHYGEWGILTKNQRFTIKRILDYIESQEEYINCLQAENKELLGKIEKLEEKNKILDLNRRIALLEKEPLYENIKTANAEIERLSHKCDDCAGCIQWKCDCANIEAEAVKEFAERLKMRAINRYNEYDNQEFPYATITHIDNLLKELVGEDK